MSRDRISAAETVYSQLRQMILRGELAGGQSLKARALQSQYGFGATPLREALNRLSAEHLVVNSFNHGFRVASISLKELNDLDQTRLLLEKNMLTLSIQNGDEDWEGRIVLTHYHLSKQSVPHLDVTPDKADEWEQRHKYFHVALLSACDSSWMNILLDQIETQRTRYHRYILLRAGQFAAGQPKLKKQINDQLARAMGLFVHTPLMEAALNKDDVCAGQLIADHIKLTSEVYTSIQASFPEAAQMKTTT